MGSRSPSEDLEMNDADARRKNISKSIRSPGVQLNRHAARPRRKLKMTSTRRPRVYSEHKEGDDDEDADSVQSDNTVVISTPKQPKQQSQIMTSSSTTTSHRVLHQQHYKSWTPYSQVARRGTTTSSTRSARSHDNKHKQQCSRPCTTCWARAKHEKTHKAMKIINELSLV